MQHIKNLRSAKDHIQETAELVSILKKTLPLLEKLVVALKVEKINRETGHERFSGNNRTRVFLHQEILNIIGKLYFIPQRRNGAIGRQCQGIHYCSQHDI